MTVEWGTDLPPRQHPLHAPPGRWRRWLDRRDAARQVERLHDEVRQWKALWEAREQIWNRDRASLVEERDLAAGRVARLELECGRLREEARGRELLLSAVKAEGVDL